MKKNTQNISGRNRTVRLYAEQEKDLQVLESMGFSIQKMVREAMTSAIEEKKKLLGLSAVNSK
ncbi:TPA: hypothetical protein MYP09_001406 [Citrobacter farmeri]|nr:hypothetical protein [Citrobacter farmeri]